MPNFFFKMRESISEDKIESVLNELNQNLASSRFHDEIILQQAKLTNLNKQERLGLLSFEEASRIRNRIGYQLLEMLEEVRNDQESVKILRHNQKWIKSGSGRLKIHVLFPKNSNEFFERIYHTTEFADANDFLNEIFLEMSDKIQPGTYGVSWVLIDSISGEELSTSTIEKRISQFQFLLEAPSRERKENLKFKFIFIETQD